MRHGSAPKGKATVILLRGVSPYCSPGKIETNPDKTTNKNKLLAEVTT
jgi:hypothetical protein